MRRLIASVLSFVAVAAVIADNRAGINQIPPVSDEAPVVMWMKPPNSIGPRNSDFRGCRKPRESSTFRHCTSERGFPSFAAACQCVKCHLQLSLLCHVDGKWYPSEGTDLCDPSKHKQCGGCPVDKIPESTVTCRKTKNGFFGERRKCYCKNNCKGVTFLCLRTLQWRSDYKAECQDTPSTNIFIPEQNMYTRFDRGNYIYSCKTGYIIKGADVVQCLNGEINGTQPICVKHDGQITTTSTAKTTTTDKATTTTTVTSTSTTTPSTTTKSTTQEIIFTSPENPEIISTSNPENIISVVEISPTLSPEEEITSSATSMSSESEENTSMIEDPDFDMYRTPNEKKPGDKNTPKKFPLTVILISVFVILGMVLVGLGLFILSKHYIFICDFGRRQFSSKTGFSIKPNEMVI